MVCMVSIFYVSYSNRKEPCFSLLPYFQFAFTPIILSTFISSLWTLEGIIGDATEENKKKTITTRLQETLPDVLVANWMLWGPVQLFNFRVVPQKYQVLFANMISLVWNAYLSFSTRGVAPAIDPQVEQEILCKAPLPVQLAQRMSEGGHAALKD